MFKSLNTRLGVTLVLVALLICSSYGFISYQYILKQQLADKQILNRDLATNLVQQLDWLPGDQLEDSQWSQILDSFMSINPGIEVYLLDLQGNIKATGNNSNPMQRQYVDTKPLLQHIDGDHMYPLIGQDPLAEDLDKPFTVASIVDSLGQQGYLYVVLQSQQQREFEANKRASYYWLISMYILAVSLTIGSIIAVIFFRKFTRRIKRLTHVVRQFRDNEFSGGDYHLQLRDDYYNDEIGFLNQSFDSMTQRIQSQIARIKTTDENRRNLLAGISHDLRTPLTALRGHLEILSCKTDQLDAQKNKQYLDICIKNAIRIETMIEDVFQLSRLQAREIKLVEEQFSILDLAQDVLFLYKPMAENKGVELELDLNSTQSVPSVWADIGLIERVLENLINNAIKHTDKGKIKVLIDEEIQQVKISIIDNGKGIEPEDQKMIFHPYYQVETGNTLESTGGLGLAICDKILALHQQKLSLISEPGKGSCFFFYLGK